MENKKTITSSELASMVAEATKRVMSELDWKTYASAVNKSMRPDKFSDKDKERQRRFHKKASEAFNDEFGYEGEFEEDGVRRTERIKGTPIGFNGVASAEIDDELTSTSSFINDKTEGETKMKRFNKHSEKAKEAYGKAKDELRKYAKGEYSYDKEKGWVSENKNTIKLTSKQLTDYITEAVARYLREDKSSGVSLPSIVLREEKEQVTLEHYLNEIELIVGNTHSIYNDMLWCAIAIMKKVKRGIEPSFDHLVNSSIVKTIQREAVKEADKYCEMPGKRNEVLSSVREIIANKILDMVDDMR